MLPPAPHRRTATLALLTATALAVPCSFAQDGQNLDAAEMLKALRQFREQTATKAKADKTRAIQEVGAAAASAEGAVNAWEKAVIATQFDGVAKEVAAFKAWREGEGEALKEPEVKSALRLYFQWLSLTLQRSSGTLVKDLLPAVINYTKELANDQALMANHNEAVKHEREKNDKNNDNRRGPGGGGPGGGGPGGGGPGGGRREDDNIRKMHDQILEKPLAASIVVQWLKLGEWVSVDKWENTPGDLDGIFENIILPELRAQRDPRALEYWDNRIKRESEKASLAKLEFERDKFNTQRLPVLFWRRAVEMTNVGMRSKAATEMFNLIRKYPTHPDVAEWMAKLEEILMPSVPATTSATPATPPPVGYVPPLPR
jgi:hypothetical protein